MCTWGVSVYFFFILKCHLSVVSPVPDYVKATVETVLKIHETEDDGDVLAFLTGQVGEQVHTNIQPLVFWISLTANVLCVYFTTFYCLFSYFTCLLIVVSFRKRWRRWCPSCRTRPGLCHDMA